MNITLNDLLHCLRQYQVRTEIILDPVPSPDGVLNELHYFVRETERGELYAIVSVCEPGEYVEPAVLAQIARRLNLDFGIFEKWAEDHPDVPGET